MYTLCLYSPTSQASACDYIRRKFLKPFKTALSGLERVFTVVRVLTVVSDYRVLAGEYECTYFFVFDNNTQKYRNSMLIEARA